MKTPSAKAKARRLQNYVAMMVNKNLDVKTDDIRPAIMGENGMDIKLSAKGKKQFPFAVECKNQEKLNIWEALNQAEDNAEGLVPLVVFKRNRTKVYVALEFGTFLGILKSMFDLQEKL